MDEGAKLDENDANFDEAYKALEDLILTAKKLVKTSKQL